MGYRSAAEAKSMIVRWTDETGMERQTGPMTFGDALRARDRLVEAGAKAKIESAYAGLTMSPPRRSWNRGLRGTPKEHAREARDLIANAKKLLRKGTCESVTSALIASAEAHAHAEYVPEGQLDWQAWEIQSAARDRLALLSCSTEKPSRTKLKRVAGLGAFADHYPRDRWVRLTKKDLSRHGDVLREFFTMLESSYAPIGGHLTIKKPQDLLTDPDFSVYYAIDMDVDREADAFMIAKTSKWGDKSVAAGTDGTAEAKRSMLAFKTKQLKTRGYYAEVSGPMAQALLRDSKVPVVSTPAQVEAVLGKKVEWRGCQPPSKPGAREACGWYTRKIGGSDVTKLLVGRPSQLAAGSRTRRRKRGKASTKRTPA